MTPEQVDKIAKAETEIEAGNFFTSAQMRDYFATAPQDSNGDSAS